MATFVQEMLSENMMKDYFDTKNEIFFEFLDELFEFKKSKKWDDIARGITVEKIKRTYRKFAELFPVNIDYLSELEKSKSSFSSIHYGDIKGNRIIDEVVRFSLYSDKIIVFHPIQNPSITNEQMDPRKAPKYWMIDFLDALYFYIVIRKWVDAGIVKLIINPYEYNLDLRDKIDKQIMERRVASNVDYMKIGREPVMNNLAEQFAVIYKNRSRDYVVDALLKMEDPRFSNVQASEFADKIMAAIERINPLHNKLNIAYNQAMLMPMKSGGPVESIMLISEKTNGSIYTPSEFHWKRITDLGVNDFWTKANRMYSTIPLTFLNNVDTNFALQLRKDERLAGVRSQMKKIYSELNGLDPGNIPETKIRDIQEGFIEEVRKAEAEWNDIRTQAYLTRASWIGTNIGVPIVANEVVIAPFIVSSIAWLISNEKSNLQKEKIQRQRNGLSVFVDLKNQKQSFFSDLKKSLI